MAPPSPSSDPGASGSKRHFCRTPRYVHATATTSQYVHRGLEQHAEIHRLRAATWTIRAIARRLGLDHKTVRRYLTTDLDLQGC
ncbi:helix-turn-helix domain-containing protein [Actinacidiphila oryziradicis]|uniref:Helix-turn-helix domain-containing protein n=1 Tax=Actinacidiphila oryziradicis TaxID=2571141 RepID=A0A4U0S288_9ACTN|nr:helix-turn-helix domain-containing protein [Actinacidiphila oryziradicis]TJZ94654.1 hypothetical protein FCI23_53205 [Actinacidiphila oryziradicis]